MTHLAKIFPAQSKQRRAIKFRVPTYEIVLAGLELSPRRVEPVLRVVVSPFEHDSLRLPVLLLAPQKIAALQKQMKNEKRPTVFIEISERHVGQATIDPAALTELTFFCKETGFTVIDPQEGNKNQADVVLLGEGLSEFGSRHENLMSVKARLELKAVDRKSGETLAIDRAVTVAVDLSEQLAGKSALQDAAANIAERVLPKLAGKTKAEDNKAAKK